MIQNTTENFMDDISKVIKTFKVSRYKFDLTENEVIENLSNLNETDYFVISLLKTSYVSKKNDGKFITLWIPKRHINDILGLKSIFFFMKEHLRESLFGVNLSGCSITKLPRYLFNLKNISVINLSYNHMKGEVPEDLFSTEVNRTIPKIIILNNNCLSGEVPIIKWASLAKLDLSHNSFESLPHRFLYNHTTKPLFINLSYNHISGEVPFLRNKKLRKIYLSHNFLTKFSKNCFGNETDYYLRVKIDNNNIDGILEIKNPKMTYLEADNNSIKELRLERDSRELFEIEISLRDNLITRMPEISDRRLKKLDLEGNRIGKS